MKSKDSIALELVLSGFGLKRKFYGNADQCFVVLPKGSALNEKIKAYIAFDRELIMVEANHFSISARLPSGKTKASIAFCGSAKDTKN